MVMTDEEICRSYREAKYPKKQIKILAELNLTTIENIKWIIDGDPHAPPPRTKLSQKLSLTPGEEKTLIRLWAEGAGTKEIAHRINRTIYTVDNYARNHRDKCPAKHKQITTSVIQEVKVRHERGESTRSIARSLGISQTSARKIIKTHIQGETK